MIGYFERRKYQLLEHILTAAPGEDRDPLIETLKKLATSAKWYPYYCAWPSPKCSRTLSHDFNHLSWAFHNENWEMAAILVHLKFAYPSNEQLLRWLCLRLEPPHFEMIRLLLANYDIADGEIVSILHTLFYDQTRTTIPREVEELLETYRLSK